MCLLRTAIPKRPPARLSLIPSTTPTVASSPIFVWKTANCTTVKKVHMMGIGMTHDPIEIGVISPDMTRTKALGAGEVGYIITGAKDVSQSKVGDTLTSAVRPATEPLPGYRDPKPMVYAGLFPIDNAQFPELRDALDKLKLNDAALIYTPETSVALGFGFRCGFLGLLHMEIVKRTTVTRIRP